MSTSDILNPLTIPLVGRHMIEASAGTGKTHNITRIYVRLLVEKIGDTANFGNDIYRGCNRGNKSENCFVY